MPSWPPKKNAAFDLYVVIRDNTGEAITNPAGLAAVLSKDGGAQANSTNTPAAISAGVFVKLTLTAAEMNADVIAVSVSSTTANAKKAFEALYTVTRQIDDLAFPTVSGRSVNVAATGEADANVARWLAAAVNALVSGRVDASAGAIANDVITAAALATSAGDEIAAAILATPANKVATSASGQVTAASVAGDVSGKVIGGGAGVITGDGVRPEGQVVRRGTAQAGAASTITLDTGASAADDFYNSSLIALVAGVGAGQVRQIADYVGFTKVATVNAAWITNPDATSVFLILPDAPPLTAAELAQLRQALGVTGATQATSGTGNLDLVKAKTDALGFGLVVVTGPVLADNSLVLVKGDDYRLVDGRALEWVNAAGTWPNLTGATIKFSVGALTVTGAVVTPTGPNQKVRAEPTAAQTGGLDAPSVRDYDVEATLSGGNKVTLVLGTATIKKDVTP